MQTSKKILITIVGIIIALLITGLMALRNDVLALKGNNELEARYKEVPIENFSGLDFSGQWIVKIRQGRNYKVEVATEATDGTEPKVENESETLYFKVDSANNPIVKGNLYAKITVPSLNTIRAVDGAKIELKNFKSDSLSVVLESRSVFSGKNNKLKYSSFKASGDARLEFTDDEM